MLKKNLKPIKILIVEDDILYKNIIKDFLKEDPSFKIVGEAKDGQTAVDLAEKLKPEVIIMDIGLPVMSGIEATKKIKEFNYAIKVVILTAHSDPDEAMQSLAVGATAYVNKDVDLNHLIMIIETINNGAVWLSPLIGKRVLYESLKCYQKNL